MYHNLAQEPLGFKYGFGPKGHGISAQVCVGFEGGFGPKGHGNSAQESVGFKCGFGPKGNGNLAQALAWVALFLPASPVRASDHAGAIISTAPKFR